MQSGRFAGALTDLGIRPGDKVTLYSANCWEWVVSYYGTLMAGAVVNPVNVMLTYEEVGYVVRDCDARAVIGTHEKLEPLLPLKKKNCINSLISFGEVNRPGNPGDHLV